MITQQDRRKAQGTLCCKAECFFWMLTLGVFLFLVTDGLALESSEMASAGAEMKLEREVKEEAGQDLRIKAPGQVVFPEVETDSETRIHKVSLGNGEDKLKVWDKREESLGWTVTVMGTDLVSDKGGENEERIEVVNMGVEPIGVKEGGEGFHLGEKRNFLSETDLIMVATADPGWGKGKWEVLVDLWLTVPVNMAAGDYEGELVFTVQ